MNGSPWQHHLCIVAIFGLVSVAAFTLYPFVMSGIADTFGPTSIFALGVVVVGLVGWHDVRLVRARTARRHPERSDHRSSARSA